MAKAPHPLDSWREANAAEAAAVRAAADTPSPSPDPADELLLDDRIVDPPMIAAEAPIEATPRRASDFILGALCGIAAAGWVALVALSGVSPTNLSGIVTAVATASGPLALIGIGWILFQRSGRREAKRFPETAQSMRAESARLEAAIARVTQALDVRRQSLSIHTDALLAEGGKAAERLAQISMDMRDESDLLARQTDTLAQAAAGARGDIGALMADLPKARDLSQETADHMKAIAGSAVSQSESLAEQLTQIIARSHEADELIGAAAGRIANHVGRIESRSERAARAIDEAGTALVASSDKALLAAGEAIDQARQGVEAQQAAMVAMIDHARAAIDDAGSTAAQAIAERMDALSTQAEAFGARLSEQDRASRLLVEQMNRALGEIEARFESLGATGTEQTADLAEMVVALSEHVDGVGRALDGSMAGVRSLSDRANALRIAFDAVNQVIERDMPAAMKQVEAEAARGDSAIRAVSAQAEQLAATVERATDRLDSADLLIDRQRNAVAGLGDQAARRMAAIAAEGDALLDRQRELSDSFAEEAAARLEALRDHSTELGRLIAESEKNMRSLAELSGSRLVEAILKVRETAGEAARGAKAALESVIPDASEKLARSGAEAIERAFGDQITQRIHLISDTAEAAVAAANHASEKLLKQLLSIAEASANLEERALTLDKRRPAPQADPSDNFAGEVAVLVDGLKAAAIDVTRVLSANVADTAWTAYLAGDHGVFAREAVRLLDAGEAQHLATYCQRNPAFRAQVDRYVAAFESMLGRILDSRDGAPLGVTMLSSDMGKLYVALAQAIDRLRF
ncbi:hypothetical protein [Sphingomonas crocodyli]|uniref:ATPase n=1 Tax=Sphingomonas crocodyli TaxID=1979270 RepID=A0A437M420_9SPHN|nr:hypothetical protein [Sphingomonas crocodyli]RVT92440.1 hypothetical protein EOD43_00450 [Sphingomonas crocodyli]